MNKNFRYELVGQKEDGKEYYLRQYPLNNKLTNLADIIKNASHIAEGGYIYLSGDSEYVKFLLYNDDELVCELEPHFLGRNEDIYFGELHLPKRRSFLTNRN